MHEGPWRATPGPQHISRVRLGSGGWVRQQVAGCPGTLPMGELTLARAMSPLASGSSALPPRTLCVRRRLQVSVSPSEIGADSFLTDVVREQVCHELDLCLCSGSHPSADSAVEKLGPSENC